MSPVRPPRDDEAVLVERDRVSEPGRAGLGADEDEERTLSSARRSSRARVLDDDPLERVVAQQLSHLGVQQHLDVRRPLDPVDEVARHVLAELVAADEEPDLRRVPCDEEQRRLPGRVAAADDDHRAVRAERGLHRRRGVVDAAALELLEASDVELPVARARREEDRPRLDPFVFAEADASARPSATRSRPPRPGTMIVAPNFRAWIAARSASSPPEMPSGKPR